MNDGDADELGAHPHDYTNMPDSAAGIMVCLRCLTAATIRVAVALEAANRMNIEGPE